MYQHILLAVDLTGGDSWKKPLKTSIELCRVFSATLHLCTVVPDFGMSVVAQFFPDNYEEDVLAQVKRDLHAFSKNNIPADIKVQHVILHGTIYEEILEAARRVNADLIVVSAHRPELSDYLIGPNAARVVRHAGCSVLVVRD